LKFTVSNKFNINRGDTTQPSGIGLLNVRKRLKYLYEDKHELETYEDGDIFKAKLTIIL